MRNKNMCRAKYQGCKLVKVSSLGQLLAWKTGAQLAILNFNQNCYSFSQIFAD